MTETGMPQAKLFAALAALQAELPRVGKGETAKVPGKDGKQGYSYTYADLADVSQAVLPLLGKHGLAFIAKPTVRDGEFGLDYKLVHSSGESDGGFYLLPSPKSTAPQQVGSAITYARRYCLCSVTGVAPDGDDDDAASAQNGHWQSAGAAFENASPVRPRPAAPAAVAVTKDEGWLDGALATAAAGEMTGDECRALWKESAAKVRAGDITKADATRIQDLLRARLDDLGREAKGSQPDTAQRAASALDPEDPWSVRVESLTDADDAGEALRELKELFGSGQMEQDRANRVFAAIRARFPQAADEARKAA